MAAFAGLHEMARPTAASNGAVARCPQRWGAAASGCQAAASSRVWTPSLEMISAT